MKPRREDVIAWPDDPEARALLEEYFDQLAATPDGGVLPELAADLCDFSRADLSGLNLGSAFLFNTNLSGARMIGCTLAKANLNGADLRNADFTSANLHKAEAQECLGDEAIFRNAYMVGVSFSLAQLRNSDFRGAILNSTFFWGADLSGADLTGCHLLHASFGSADRPTIVDGVRLSDATFDHLTSGHVVGTVDVGEETTMPLDGSDLADWFRKHGAGNVQCLAHP